MLLPGSTPRRAFDSIVRRGVLIASESTLLELARVLKDSKFERYLTSVEREAFLVALLKIVEVVEVKERIRICRDPSDDKFLEAAVAGRAEAIVTGDADLLALDPYRGIRIMSPAEFLGT